MFSGALADCAKIFFSGARALYLGKAFGLEPHRNAVAVLCAGVSGSFEIAINPEAPEAGYTGHRMALIPANTLHHLKAGAETMAFLYLDTHSSDYVNLRKRSTGVAVRRYKLWNRMGCAVRAMAEGESLTDAALRAGFSSAAHFSAAFSEMFGMPPSRLAQTPLQIQESPLEHT